MNDRLNLGLRRGLHENAAGLTLRSIPSDSDGSAGFPVVANDCRKDSSIYHDSTVSVRCLLEGL
jgi:hypothetical protein